MKTFVKYIVDLGLFLSFLLVAITGVIKFKSFLAIFGIAIDYASIPIRLWSKIHDWSGIVMAVLVLVHLILNWDWIKSTTRGYFNRVFGHN